MRTGEERLRQLKKRFDFLDALIAGIGKDITGIKVKPKSEMPTGSALDPHSDSGYEYRTNVHRFGGIVVHEYVTAAPPRGNQDCELVIYVDPGSERQKIEKLYGLRSKYPFLEQIIAQQTYPLFDIEEAVVDESTLAKKCRGHDSQGPETFDEQFYSVTRNDVRELAVDDLTGERRAKKPSLTVGEKLSSEGIIPDFLVRTYHLKYEIDGQHHHDVTITVYRA